MRRARGMVIGVGDGELREDRSEPARVGLDLANGRGMAARGDDPQGAVERGRDGPENDQHEERPEGPRSESVRTRIRDHRVSSGSAPWYARAALPLRSAIPRP